ncbi:MAG: hypothetical protein ACKO96_01335, partial [Flammeovirgaceae bacterium]
NTGYNAVHGSINNFNSLTPSTSSPHGATRLFGSGNSNGSATVQIMTLSSTQIKVRYTGH